MLLNTLNSAYVCVLLLLFSFFSRRVAATTCTLSDFQAISRNLKKFDSNDLSRFQNVIMKVDDCIENNQSVAQLRTYKNELYYKIGLIHLSMGNDVKAIQAFESLQDLGESYYKLGKTRLSDLYVEFGAWNKLHKLDPEDEAWEIFQNLNNTLFQKIAKDPKSIDSIEDELTPMLNIAPYDIDTLSIKLDLLFNRLINERNFKDLTSAYEITKLHDIILEKFKSTLTLSQRIKLHYSNALIQLILLNVEPTLHLRKCLAIDMDYIPCKELSIFVSRSNKVNPFRSQLFDTQTYSNNENIDWNKIIKYYTVEKRENVINYDWIHNKVISLINDNEELLITSRPITRNLFPIEIKNTKINDVDNLEFFKFVEIILCQANMELSLTKNKEIRTKAKQNMTKHCKKTLKNILSKEQWNVFVDTISKKDAILSDDLLKYIWNTYPTLAIYMVDNIITRKNFKQNNEKLQEQLIKFFNDENLFSAENPYIKKEAIVLQKLLNKKQQMMNEQRQREQRQQQQQQRNFFEQFAQGQRGHQYQQQEQQQPPPMQHTDKDYYKVLGVQKGADSKEIRKAYLNLTKKYHPDKQGSLSEDEEKKVHEKMSEINEAYELLSDTDKRSEYDQMRSGGGQRRPQGGNRFNGQGNPFANVRYGF